MKKFISAFLSVALILTTTLSISVTALAGTKNDATKYALGDTFTVSYNSKTTEDTEYCASFTPTTSGYYEFTFDTATKYGMIFACVTDSDDEEISMTYSVSEKEYGESDYSTPPTVGAYMKAGSKYYLTLDGFDCKTYTSNVTINEHTHTIDTLSFSAYYDADKDYRYDGGKYKYCARCDYEKTVATYYYPKTITLSSTSYTYNGKEKKPTVTVKDRKGNTLKEGTDYKVKYSSGRKNAGKYTVTVIFKGNYDGEGVKTFTIKPKSTSISSLTATSKGFTAKVKKQTTQTSGYQIQYATDSKFTKNKGTATIYKNSVTSKSVTKLKANKKYYVRVRTFKTVKVDGKSTKVYSSWSKAKTVTTKK